MNRPIGLQFSEPVIRFPCLVAGISDGNREDPNIIAIARTTSASSPKLFAMIEDDRLFEKTAHIQGFDPTLTTFVRSSVAGMIYLQLMLPCVPQLMNYFKTERALGEIGLRWHRNMGAHLLAGIPWNNSDTPSAGYQEV